MHPGVHTIYAQSREGPYKPTDQLINQDRSTVYYILTTFSLCLSYVGKHLVAWKEYGAVTLKETPGKHGYVHSPPRCNWNHFENGN